MIRKVEPELFRPLAVDRVPAKGCFEKVTADAAECSKIAKRLAIPALHKFAATLQVKPWRGGGLKITGTVFADLDLVSVVSLETFRTDKTFEVERYFVPERDAPKGDDADDADIDAINGGEIDLGELIVETVALELDPYPRKPGEDFSGYETKPEPEVAAPVVKISPFAVLKTRKDGD
jgi:uncharacterized metal-binding protein YceD (DUF177 family)